MDHTQRYYKAAQTQSDMSVQTERTRSKATRSRDNGHELKGNNSGSMPALILLAFFVLAVRSQTEN